MHFPDQNRKFTPYFELEAFPGVNRMNRDAVDYRAKNSDE